MYELIAGGWRVAGVAVLVVGAAVCVGRAQDAGQDLLGPLRNGKLTVWVVRPARRVDPKLPQFRAAQPGYSESTTGALGQTSSTYGQTAGSYGVSSSSETISVEAAEQRRASVENGGLPGYQEQTSGSFGTDSSNVGTEASNHGTDVSGLGQTSSSYGTASSNHGQTAGSFGTASSNYGANAGPNGGPGQAAVAARRRKLVAASTLPGTPPEMLAFASSLARAFPGAQIVYAQVDAGELRDDLKLVDGTRDYPDVLVGSFPEGWASGMQREFGVVGLKAARYVESGLDFGYSPRTAPAYSVLLKAPHPAAARAFAVWVDERQWNCTECGWGDDPAAPAVSKLATSAVQRLLQGKGLGEDADPEMAQFNPAAAAAAVLTTADGSRLDATGVQVGSAYTVVNGALAAVSVRVLAAGNAVFGLAHPLVVLRLGGDGKWKVLQVSLNLPAAEQHAEMSALAKTEPVKREEREAGVVGVTQASPEDGARVSLKPELWWDNGGGAALEVIEWQLGGATAPSRLFLVPDMDPLLKTRVTAAFAEKAGTYRWRVWSVGAGGVMTVSGWKRMEVQ